MGRSVNIKYLLVIGMQQSDNLIPTHADHLIPPPLPATNVELQWICGICKSSEHFPTIITVCGHTFCDECLTKIKDCPLCRKPFDQSELQTNYALVTSAQHGKKRSRDDESSVVNNLGKNVNDAKKKFRNNKRKRLDDELTNVVTLINSFIEKATTDVIKCSVNQLCKENVQRVIDIYKKNGIDISHINAYEMRYDPSQTKHMFDIKP